VGVDHRGTEMPLVRRGPRPPYVLFLASFRKQSQVSQGPPNWIQVASHSAQIPSDTDIRHRQHRQKNDIWNGRLDWNRVCEWAGREPILRMPRFENGGLKHRQSSTACQALAVSPAPADCPRGSSVCHR